MCVYPRASPTSLNHCQHVDVEALLAALSLEVERSPLESMQRSALTRFICSPARDRPENPEGEAQTFPERRVNGKSRNWPYNEHRSWPVDSSNGPNRPLSTPESPIESLQNAHAPLSMAALFDCLSRPGSQVRPRCPLPSASIYLSRSCSGQQRHQPPF